MSLSHSFSKWAVLFIFFLCNFHHFPQFVVSSLGTAVLIVAMSHSWPWEGGGSHVLPNIYMESPAASFTQVPYWHLAQSAGLAGAVTRTWSLSSLSCTNTAMFISDCCCCLLTKEKPCHQNSPTKPFYHCQIDWLTVNTKWTSGLHHSCLCVC